MNIIHAIKSGKPFRLKLKNPKSEFEEEDYWYANEMKCANFTREDLLAEDWEILICREHGQTEDDVNNLYLCPNCTIRAKRKKEQQYYMDISQIPHVYSDEIEDMYMENRTSEISIDPKQREAQRNAIKKFFDISTTSTDDRDALREECDQINKEIIDDMNKKEKKCECGADSSGVPYHYPFCPKFQSYKADEE